MTNVVQLQSSQCSNWNQRKMCSFDIEVIEKPTKPLIHQAARFLFINRGSGKIKIQNTEYDLKPDTTVAILPWEISEVTAVQNTLQYYILVYQFDSLNEIIKSFYNTDNEPVDIIQRISYNPVVNLNSIQANKIRDIILSIRNEVGTESTLQKTSCDALSNVYVTSQLIALIVLFERSSLKQGTSSKKAEINRCEIFRYIYNHLNEKLTLKMLSQVFYLSESSVSFYIRQVTGLSFFDLLNEMRMGKTINFLLYTDFTLEELAEFLGYVDASHISKVFAARIGMKITEYRKTYQKVNDICKVKESKKSYMIVSYIYRHSAENLTARNVARNFGITVTELHKVLIYQVEKNFDNFLNFIRINRACKLLLNTNMKITDIAIEVGFNTVKTFTRNFLKYRVMTPTAFRQKVNLQQYDI